MKLLDLHEDLFQYVCRLNRAARTEAHPDYARVRSEIKTLTEDLNRNAASDVRLSNQVRKLELPIVFFIDNLICTSRLKFAPQWIDNRLARERYNELAGDERFFDLLEQDLADTSEEAAERLAVYYVCLGLGFTGMYQGRPGELRKYMEQIFPRVRQWIDSESTKISKEAYNFTDTRVLTEPPSKHLVLVVIAFAFLSLTVLSIYYAFYAKAVVKLEQSLETISKNAKAKP